MDKIRNYDIAFVGLKNGKHEFDFEITQAFFELFDTEKEFTAPKLNIKVFLEKHSTFLEFNIQTLGTINLECDITGEEFSYPIDENINILVKFGEDYDDSNEEVITIPHQDYAFNIAQLIYESVMLAVPMKKISPNLSDKDFELLEKFSPTAQNDKEEPEGEIDPRWEALRKLKN
ncbi:YceD family protein [Bergeyella cardium]|uniref:DUF177 domain-containing protein n=1 Tax=Bergeyella cardium TaxID=1585976 RepID=A0A6P1QVU5_9FLAO|nr:DUF177 domain-containing protein [Bergeyella cardium]QHN64951.1 DUF177 domain-containing protein [Bergeyella cardium]WHE34264.1 DUF177 domain-containing protein [Bergeyella cardium]WHF60915.1 DUF177 domain-containing protein [Bergeyella cardium]